MVRLPVLLVNCFLPSGERFAGALRNDSAMPAFYFENVDTTPRNRLIIYGQKPRLSLS
jgi:hypothetical protein